ncbi:tetratricopeptide repeat protein [Aquimarina sp. AU474]|uniref:tetratricopeptide repeat-containing sensor histidine kinase n=1 Tax=Aquimarina sp. AU474 TaxID=2108529 RepID=UPI000D686356|nr:tetratricopeptide repeat protein [Aquimarina sp. AU474]
MIKLTLNCIRLSFILWSTLVVCQIDSENLSALPKGITIEAKEKKLVDDAYFLFNNNQVEKSYVIAHQLKKTLKTERAKFNCNLLLAYYFKNKALIDSSIYYVNQSLKFERLDNDSIKTKGRSSAYNILAVNYKNKGLLQQSKKWHLKGIEESQKYNEKDLYYTHTHGLALTYGEMQNYSKALELFEECSKYEGDPEIVFGSYINMGMIYSSLKDYESSDKYFKKGQELSQKQNKQSALAIILLNLAANAQEQNKLNKAIDLYEEVIVISEKIDLHNIKLIAKMNIGSVFIDAKNYKDAQLIYGTALHDAIELGLLSQQLNIYKNLKQIAIEQGNYKNAFTHITDYFKIKDSIYKLQKDEEINELEIRYSTLRKEKEITILQIENSNRKLELTNQKEAIENLRLQQEIENKESENQILAFQNASEKRVSEINLLKKDQEIQESKLIRQKSLKNTILYSFLILLVPIIGLLIIYYQKLQAQSELNKKQEEVSEQKISSLIKSQELKLIKASIEGQDKERKRIAQELHDSIGGNLAAIKLQLNNTFANGKAEALQTINTQLDDTYEQVRDLSHNLIPKKFRKNNFCEVLESYFNNIGEASNLKTSFIVYPRVAIDELDEFLQIETFKIIQELITNTIKHAKASSVELQINLVENVLNLLFEDNGVGFNTKNNSTGIGFENIKSRLRKLSGTFHIDSRINRGTIINIEIPT